MQDFKHSVTVLYCWTV